MHIYGTSARSSLLGLPPWCAPTGRERPASHCCCILLQFAIACTLSLPRIYLEWLFKLFAHCLPLLHRAFAQCCPFVDCFGGVLQVRRFSAQRNDALYVPGGSGARDSVPSASTYGRLHESGLIGVSDITGRGDGVFEYRVRKSRVATRRRSILSVWEIQLHRSVGCCSRPSLHPEARPPGSPCETYLYSTCRLSAL